MSKQRLIDLKNKLIILNKEVESLIEKNGKIRREIKIKSEQPEYRELISTDSSIKEAVTQFQIVVDEKGASRKLKTSH